MDEADPKAESLDAGAQPAAAGGIQQAWKWTPGEINTRFDTPGGDPTVGAAVSKGLPVPPDVWPAHGQVVSQGQPEKPRGADCEAIRRHIEWHVERARGEYDDALFEIAFGNDGPDQARLFGLDEVDAAVSFAAEQNVVGRNVYLGMALKLPETCRIGRTGAKDNYVATTVGVDVDEDLQQTKAKLDAVAPASLIVQTGTVPEARAHLYVRLHEPCADVELFGRAISALVEHVGGDLKAKDAARVMRLGGTRSYPNRRKADAGYREELTTVTIMSEAKSVDIDMLAALAPGAPSASEFTAVQRPKSNGEIVRSLGTCGRVVDGREAFWRNLLLTKLSEYQLEHGADPTAEELFDASYVVFSDPWEVENGDGRWTCAEGQRRLRQRASNTIRRLRSGGLARWGLYSIETEAGKEQALAVRPQEQPSTHPAALPVSDTRLLDPWETYIVPDFPMECIPPQIATFAAMQAKSTGADINACVMAALTVCSGALDQEIKLKMLRTGSWFQRPGFWCVLCGDPSVRKSPAMNASVAPLRAIENKRRAEYQEALEAWQADKSDDKGEAPDKPPRLLISDTTSEKAGHILSAQTRGTLMVADEMTGWIGGMDKYGGGKGGAADRAFWLQAYNGGPYTVDRVTRGEIFVQNLAVSFLTGVQPDRLAEMANLTTDGLLQRFIPVMMRASRLPEEVDEEGPIGTYARLIAELEQAQVQTLSFTDDALVEARQIREYLHFMEKLEVLGGGFTTFVGKLPGVHGALCIVLHHIRNGFWACCRQVDAETTANAARIIRDFIIPHAFCFYQTLTKGKDWDMLRALASYMLTQDKDRFTPSDFTSGVRALRGMDQREVAQKLSPFVAGGWIEEEGTVGPPKAWNLRPGVRQYFADRRETEVRRKAEVQAQILSLVTQRSEGA